MIPTYKYGTIPAGGVATVNVGGYPAPFTASLTSTAEGRQIAYAPNTTVTPEPATPDTEAAGWISFGFLAPMCIVQFSGNAGDAWEIR